MPTLHDCRSRRVGSFLIAVWRGGFYRRGMATGDDDLLEIVRDMVHSKAIPIKPAPLAAVMDSLGVEEARHVFALLLRWVDEQQYSFARPLKRGDRLFTRTLRRAVAMPPLSRVFAICEDTLAYAPDLSPEKRREIERYVTEYGRLSFHSSIYPKPDA